MEDFDPKLCRLCLHKASDSNDLISLIKLEDFVETIKDCLSIEITINDELPQTACSLCIQKVQDWHSFKEECLRSNAKLLEWKYNKENLKNVKLEEEFVSEETEYVEVKNEKTNETQSEVSDAYSCDICSKNFNTVVDYLDHQLTHNGTSVFKCDKCQEIFNSREDLVFHDKKHERHRRPCPKCGKLIFSSYMRSHLIKHTDKFKCTICDERFSSNYLLNDHINVNHTKETKHKCKVCEKEFLALKLLKAHVKTVHLAGRTHKCNFCNYAAKRPHQLKAHMTNHSTKEFICHICSKVTKNLDSHVKRTHLKEKKHECSYCYKRFSENHMLQYHIRRHKGERPFVCQLCGKNFSGPNNLKKHMTIHGERTWYQCDRCQKKYCTKQGLTNHPCKPNVAQ